MNPLKISVIVPNYNYADYIGDCIRSLLVQDYDNFEVIVVDDGSTDGSWDVIQSFGDQIKAVRVQNGGALKACLIGTDHAQGDYIYVVDSDDRLANPHALSIIAAACAKHPSKVQFPLVPVNAAGEVIGPAFPDLRSDQTSDDMIAQIMIDGSYATPPTSGNVYRRDVWEISRQVDYETAQDGIVYLLAPFKGQVLTLEEPLAQYRIHGRNDSSSATSEGRLLREAERFAHRIEHLRNLLPPSVARGLRPGPGYFFFNDRIVVNDILHTEKLSTRIIARAMKSLWRSGFPLRRKVIFGVWLLSVTFAPRGVRKALANVRQNGKRMQLVPRSKRAG